MKTERIRHKLFGNKEIRQNQNSEVDHLCLLNVIGPPCCSTPALNVFMRATLCNDNCILRDNEAIDGKYGTNTIVAT